MNSSAKGTQFWNTFLRAVGAEPREAKVIRGASGLEHSVLAVGVDERRRRVVAISQEHDARAAAMALADMQYALPDIRVLLARPVAVDAGEAARAIAAVTGKPTVTEIDPSILQTPGVLDAVLKPLVERGTAVFGTVNLNVIGQVLQLVQQLSLVRVTQPSGSGGGVLLSLEDLARHDPTGEDQRYGICSIPLYRLSAQDLDTLGGQDVDAAQALLRAADIFQYFFPAPDHLALGLADGGALTSDRIDQAIGQVPSLGHPYGKNELVEQGTQLEHLLDALKERGLAAEGEVGLELTEGGKTVRAAVKFKPREGLLAKLVNRISVSISLKDLFGGK